MMNKDGAFIKNMKSTPSDHLKAIHCSKSPHQNMNRLQPRLLGRQYSPR